MPLNSGILWIVATPLGNPGDLSARARELLGGVDGILAEDTRRAGQLLTRCGIVAPAFTSLHEHNEEARLPRVLGWLKEGKHLALISDAGTPLLSDPGYRLVRACRNAGIRVSPVPGPSALLAALCASGLPPYPFVFLGFPPRKETERKNFFAPFAHMDATLVFFERKDRLAASLASASHVLGPREVCIARELTKTHEEFLFFPLAEYGSLEAHLLGEMTVLIGPPLSLPRTDPEEIDRLLVEEETLGGKARDVARRVRDRASGWQVKDIYQRMRGRALGRDI